MREILPFIEQSSLWTQIEAAYIADKDFLHIPPHTIGSVRMNWFGCPSDSRSARISKHDRAFTSYLGVAGTNYFMNDGVLYMDSRISMAAISDGTSNTLIVGERPPSGDELFGWWYAGWGQNKTGSGDLVLGVQEVMVFREYYTVCSRGPYRYKPGKIDDVRDAFHFWSKHPNGANFLFCDGSVHFLNYSAASVMPALATHSGSESVSSPN